MVALKNRGSWAVAALTFPIVALARASPASASSSSPSSSPQTSSLQSFCVQGGSICAAINIPSATDDIFVQIQAQKSTGWAAVGIGSQMDGSLIFLTFPSADGKNVTLSPRLGKGHIEPLFDSSIQTEVLGGTGFNAAGDRWTIDFKCSNCRTWSGGSLNVKSTKQPMIWSFGGSSQNIMSNDQRQTIMQHQDMGVTSLNIVKATGGPDSGNPFAGKAATIDNSSSSSASVSVPLTKADKVLIAHGSIMAVIFVILFPLGAAFIRLLSDSAPHALNIHRCLQTFNAVLAIVGMALGIYTSELNADHFEAAHQYIGVIIVGLLFVQGALGQLHHIAFQRIGKRTFWSHMHIWLGRFVILFGIVNCGLGLQLAVPEPSKGEEAAFAVIAIVVFVTYVSFYWIKHIKAPSGSTRVK